MLINSHTHSTCDTLYPQIYTLIDSTHKVEVEMTINIFIYPNALGRDTHLKETYPQIYNVAATTSYNIEKEVKEIFPHMKKATRESNIIAISESERLIESLCGKFPIQSKGKEEIFLPDYGEDGGFVCALQH